MLLLFLTETILNDDCPVTECPKGTSVRHVLSSPHANTGHFHKLTFARQSTTFFFIAGFIVPRPCVVPNLLVTALPPTYLNLLQKLQQR